MSNIDVVKRGMQAFSAGDVATLDQMVADDFVLTGAAPQPLGKAEFLGLCQANHTAFSDFDFHARDFEENGDVVTLNTAVTATHTGPLALIGLRAFSITILCRWDSYRLSMSLE